MYEQLDLKLIGSRIKAVRTSRGMSQADLAVKASVSLPLISNIERGKTSIHSYRRCQGGSPLHRNGLPDHDWYAD